MRWAPVLLCAVLLGSSRAFADGKRQPLPRHSVQFAYTRGPDTAACPTETTMMHLLIAYYGYDPIQPAPELRIEISAARRGKAYHAEILLKSMAGKELWAEQMDDPAACTLLMRDALVAARVHASIILNPAPFSSAPEKPSPEVAPKPESTAETTPTAPLAPLPTPRLSPPLPPVAVAPRPPLPARNIGAGLGADVSLGLVPGVGLGGHMALTWASGHVAVSGEARVLASARPTLQSVGQFERPLTGRFVGGALVPCYQASPLLSVCGVAHLGEIVVSTRDYRDLGRFRAAVGARAGLGRTFSNGFRLEGLAELTEVFGSEIERNRGKLPLWSSPPVAGGAMLKLSWDFIRFRAMTR